MTLLPPAPWRDRPGLAELNDALDASGGMTRIVGGAVRDTLLGVDVVDVDLATRLLPDEVAARVKAAGFKAVPTGLTHGTLTVVLPSGPIEVTTLRRDVSTDGRRATVAFTDDWREDAARRDFTINALSADPSTGHLYDYFGGLADLAVRRVRFIGDPFVRIAEDHLRILRFFRFHARFGTGMPDAAGLAACETRANDLMALSRERIAAELLNLLAVTDPTPTIALMVERGIWRPVLPEIEEAGVERLARLIEREAATGVARDPVRRLAALLPPDRAIAVSVASRLKLSNAQRQRLELAADRSQWVAAGSAWQRAHGIGTGPAIDQLLIGDEPVQKVAAMIGTMESGVAPTFPIKGRDLIALGMKAGPAVARTLQGIERAWVAADFPDEAWVRAEADRAMRDSS